MSDARRWMIAAASLAATALSLGIFFSHPIAAAVGVWLDSTAYNHCFLILPVALYLAWQRREVLAEITPVPVVWPLVLLVPLSVVWLLAARLGVLEAQQLLIVTMFQVAAFAILGWTAYRAFMAPLLYLYFLVPAGYFLVPSLQNFTAWFIVRGLQVLHIPVYWDGTVIDIPAGRFVVAEACAGLRFLVASVAFGVLYAVLVYRGTGRRLAFIGLSIVVPIIANGLRGLGLLVLAQVSGSTTAVMADHILYGWLFFSLVTLLLILIGMTFSDADRKVPRPALSDRAAPVAWQGRWRFAMVTMVAIACAGSGPAYAQLLEWRHASLRLADAAPTLHGDWQREMPAEGDWKPRIFNPDRAFYDAFVSNGARVLRYVAVYAPPSLEDNLARGQNEIADFESWHLIGHGQAKVEIEGREATVATTEIELGARHVLVWHFFVVGDRIMASPLAAKLTRLRGMFDGHSTAAAYIAIATTDDPLHSAAEQLQRFLGDMEPMRTYLLAAAR